MYIQLIFQYAYAPAAASNRRYDGVVLCPVGNKPIPPEEGEADAKAADEITDETVPCLQKVAECAFENLKNGFSLWCVCVFKRI